MLGRQLLRKKDIIRDAEKRIMAAREVWAMREKEAKSKEKKAKKKAKKEKSPKKKKRGQNSREPLYAEVRG